MRLRELSGVSLLELGRIAFAHDDLTGAQDPLRDSATLFRRVGDRAGEMMARCETGLVLRLTGDVQGAHRVFGRAAAELPRIRDPHASASYHMLGGWLGWSEDRYGQGVRHFRMAVRALKKTGHVPRRLEAEIGLASCLALLDRQEQAETILRGTMRSARRIGCRRVLADCHPQLAEVHRMSDRYTSAQTELTRGIELFRRLGCRLGESWALCSLGEVLVALDRYTEAGHAYRRSLALARAVGFRQGEAWALDDLGELATMVDDYTEAVQYLEKAEEVAAAIGDRLGLGNVHRDLAELHARQEDHAMAIRHLVRARRMYEAIGDDLSQGHVLVELAREHRIVGSRSLAESRARDAIKILERIPDELGQANGLLELGKLRLDHDDREAAARHFEQGREIYRRIRNGLGVAEARLYLGRAAPADSKTGLLHLRSARDLYRHRGYRYGEAEALAELSVRYSAIGRPALAQRCSSRAVSLLEELRSVTEPGVSRVRAYRARGWMYRRALHDAAVGRAGREALLIVDSARAGGLAALMRRGSLPSSGPLASIARRVAVLESALAMHERRPVDEPEEAGQTHSRRLRHDLRKARQDLERESSTFAAAFTPRRVSLPAHMPLPPHGHALLYEVGPPDGRSGAPGWCIHVAPDGTIEVREFQISPRVVRWMERWASGEPAWLAHPSSIRAEEASILASLLLPPSLTEALSPTAVTRVAMVPSGGLWKVPLSSLPLRGAHLIDFCELSYTPSLQFLAAMGPAKRAIGGHKGSVAYLRRDLLSSALLREVLERNFAPLAEVGVRKLRAGMDLSDASVLTLFAHGNGQPGLSHGLELTPRRTLAAGEILPSKLPPLVTFGACSSGSLEMEPGGEPLGFPTVCLIRGARGVVCALHPVNEVVAAEILGTFYDQLASGRSPAASLRLAQLAHRAHCANCRPTHWPAWIVMGRTWETAPHNGGPP